MSLLTLGIRIICVFLVFGVFAPCALADFGMCQPGWEWANNTRQQNPCQIAGALDSNCQGVDYLVFGPLQQGTNYIAPQKDNPLAQKCDCNTVMFSLYMACTACQNVTTQRWKSWSQFCDSVYVTQYPYNISSNTAIPHWAFLNYTIQDQFDPVAAKAVGGLPEAVEPSSTPLSSSTANPADPSTTVNPTDQVVNKRTGAIVGGVIGGLVGSAVIGIGVWIFLRKRALARGDQGYTNDVGVYTGAPVSGHGFQPYDPSDPSTYPTAHVEYGPSKPYTPTSNQGHYTGAAEL